MAALERLEVRPLAAALTPESEAAATAWVEERRVQRLYVRAGEVFVARGWEFGVCACAPQATGLVGPSTEVLVGSLPVPRLERVQLTCLELAPAGEDTENALYRDRVRPYLLQLRDEETRRGGNFLAVLAQEEVLNVLGHQFGVRALDPKGKYGALTKNTEVYVDYVDTPAFARIHVLPYEDTLPAAYSYDLFRDFLRPFFQEHPFALYATGDHFAYGGVRFRVMATDPPSAAARVASETIVYSEGEPLRPTVLDLLPSELREDLLRLPRGLQALLLNTMAHEEAVRGRLAEVDTVLRRGRGLTAAQIGTCGSEQRWTGADRLGETQKQCMICLSDFEEGDTLRQLGCEHLFHKGCIDEWLQRSASCPICKRGVGSAGPNGGAGGSARASGAGAYLLQNATVAVEGGHQATVLGYDGAGRFRVRMQQGGSERLVPADALVQCLSGVRLSGLQTPGLDGALVHILGVDSTRGRYIVTPDWQRQISVRPDNCILPDGTVARVVGLSGQNAASRWNENFGRVVAFDRGRARHLIAMEPRGELLSVRPQNLRV